MPKNLIGGLYDTDILLEQIKEARRKPLNYSVQEIDYISARLREKASMIEEAFSEELNNPRKRNKIEYREINSAIKELRSLSDNYRRTMYDQLSLESITLRQAA